MWITKMLDPEMIKRKVAEKRGCDPKDVKIINYTNKQIVCDANGEIVVVKITVNYE